MSAFHMKAVAFSGFYAEKLDYISPTPSINKLFQPRSNSARTILLWSAAQGILLGRKKLSNYTTVL